MSRELDIETLTRPGGLVPVDVHTTAELVRHVLQLRSALTEAREALSALDHPNGADSGLTIIRGGREIGTIIDAALGSTVEQSKD